MVVRALAVEEVDPKWWSLDMFLAEIIALNLRDLARNGTAHPGEYTPQAWKDKLNSIATKFEAYQERLDVSSEAELFIVAEVKQAMHDLADIFPALWD